MIISTENSTYELDEPNKRVRRLNGIENPTPRQGRDGEWRDYETITEPVIGNRLLIVWEFENGVAKSTQTSPIKEIVNVQSVDSEVN
jgi:hypothetical protein